MSVLGIDTSTGATAVALFGDGGEGSERRDDPAPGEHPGHATRLLPMAAELLAEAGAGWPEVERIAVGVGPGTFTGLRVGIATARGLAQSLAIPLAGVSSLAVLAEGALEQVADTGAVLAVIDARRGEVFAAAYARDEGGLPHELVAPAALAPEDAAALAEGAADGWLGVGDGAVRYRERLSAPGLTIPPAGSPLHLIRARIVCAAGSRLSPAAHWEEIVPDYRRRPDAELALQDAGRQRPRG
jgi:tRNA threonylcarbamoyladenosine biosynthesis protein TsaB